MLLQRRGSAFIVLIAVAAMAVAGCSEQRPPLKIAEPLSAEEAKRWSDLLRKGSAPPQVGQDAEPAPGKKR